MKKTALVLAIVTVLIGVCLAAPVNAATIKLNGKIEYNLKLPDVTAGTTALKSNFENSLAGTDIDLVLTLASSNAELKVGTSFDFSNIFGSGRKVDVNLSYISLKAPGFSFWFTNKETNKIEEAIGNDDYKFEPIDFPMGIGSSLIGYTMPVTKYLADLGEADMLAKYVPLSLSFIPVASKYNALDYTYPALSLLSVKLDYLYNLSADLGSTKIDGYFGKVNLALNSASNVKMLEATLNPYEYEGDPISLFNYDLYTGMLRTKINLFGNFNLGGMISFGVVNDGTSDIRQGANAGLEISYDFKNGGKLTLAGVASFNLGLIRSEFGNLSNFDFSTALRSLKPISKGYAFTVGVSNIALDPKGNYRIGVDYTEVQIDATMPNGSYDYRLLPGTRNVGAEFGVNLDVLGQPFSVNVRNDLAWRYDGGIYFLARDIITLTGNVRINDNYAFYAKIQPTIYFENWAANFLKNSTIIELEFSGKITDKFALKAAINYVGSKSVNNNVTNYAANLIATYNDKFGAFNFVNSSYVDLAGMVGIANSTEIGDSNRTKPVVILYAQAGGIFANNFGIDLAGFISYNSMYGFIGTNPIAPEFNVVLSATARFYFNPSVCFYVTETYRNWGLKVAASLTVSNFYTEIGFRVKTTNGIFVQLSVGNSGLADEKKYDSTQYSNVMPWSWLEIIPEDYEMSFKTVKLNVKITF